MLAVHRDRTCRLGQSPEDLDPVPPAGPGVLLGRRGEVTLEFDREHGRLAAPPGQLAEPAEGTDRAGDA